MSSSNHPDITAVDERLVVESLTPILEVFRLFCDIPAYDWRHGQGSGSYLSALRKRL